MKKILLSVFILLGGITVNAQQDTLSLKQDTLLPTEYEGNYTFKKDDIISSANITYNNGLLNYETSMGSGSLIKKGVDSFITEDKKSTVIFVRDSTNKVSGVIIDDVRGVSLEGKKNNPAMPPPTSQTKHSIKMFLRKNIYQFAV